jgi:branched-chain amino acid transport system ATP-binding protein
LLSISNLNVSIASVHILRGVSLELATGSMTGLIGRNGAGKTTLMKTVMGLLKPGAGAVRFDGRDLAAVPTYARARLGIGYMPEDRRLVPQFTVEENVLLPTWTVPAEGVAERLKWIFSIMPEVENFRTRRALELSGGQQKMVALARALMGGRRILLLDEPFEGLAPALARRLGEVMASLKGEGVSILIAESNEGHISDLLSRAFRIERGSVAKA